MISHRLLFLYFIFCILNSSCSKDQEPRCYQEEDRRIVNTVTNIIGTISTDFCFGEYIIEPSIQIENNPIGLLSACNLTKEFETNGAMVVFSGYIYESFDTEDICADYFEITEISFVDE